MKLGIPKQGESILSVARRIGYAHQKTMSANQSAFVRSVGGGDFPRFHLYVTEEQARFIFNLHLDQKKPVYEGVSAHNGEYEGEIITEEATRIWEIVKPKS